MGIICHCDWNKFNESENLGETAVSAVSHLVTTLLIAGRGSICANIIKGIGFVVILFICSKMSTTSADDNLYWINIQKLP